MSVEQVKAFFAKVNEDEALAQQLKDAQAAYTGDTSDKDTAIAATVIPIAAQAGFNFTAEDFKAAFDTNEEGEASEDELNAVAGALVGSKCDSLSYGCDSLSFVQDFCEAIISY